MSTPTPQSVLELPWWAWLRRRTVVAVRFAVTATAVALAQASERADAAEDSS